MQINGKNLNRVLNNGVNVYNRIMKKNNMAKQALKREPFLHNHQGFSYEDYASESALPTPPLDSSMGSTQRSYNFGELTEPSQNSTTVLSRLLSDNKSLLGQ